MVVSEYICHYPYGLVLSGICVEGTDIIYMTTGIFVSYTFYISFANYMVHVDKGRGSP